MKTTADPPRTMSKEISSEAMSETFEQLLERWDHYMAKSYYISLSDQKIIRTQLAAMRDELERVNQQHEIDSEEIQESRAAVSSIALERTDLLQRVQALEADKKRLDWLEGDTMRLQNVFGIQLNEDARRKDVRACIDTALSQEQATPRNV